MVDSQLLNKRLKDSGYKLGYITEKLGISREAFAKKRNNKITFRTSEIYVLCDVLGIDDDNEKDKIFYAKS